MSLAFLRFSAVASVIVLLAGCGGSGSGGTTGGGGDGSPTVVTVTFKGGTPTAVAARIGSGAFTAQTLSSAALTLSIPSGTTRFAVAFVCPVPYSGGVLQFTEQTVVELTTADGTAFAAPCGSIAPTAGQTGILSGSVDARAIPLASFLEVVAQNGNLGIGTQVDSTGNFSFAAPAGSDRVEVLAYNLALNGFAQTYSLVAAKTLAGQTVPGALNGGTQVVLGAGDETTPQPIAYGNVPSGFSAPSTLVGFDMNGGDGFIVALAATNQYPALPAAAVQNGDSYSFLATTYSNSNIGQGVSVDMTSAGAGPISLAFPAPWANAGPTPAALPTFDFNYSGFSGKNGVILSAGMGWSTGTAAETESILIATASYQNGSTKVTFPNLSGLAGFPAPPVSGSQVGWSAQIVQSNSGVMQSTHPSTIMANTVMNGGTYSVP